MTHNVAFSSQLGTLFAPIRVAKHAPIRVAKHEVETSSRHSQTPKSGLTGALLISFGAESRARLLAKEKKKNVPVPKLGLRRSYLDEDECLS